MAFPLDTLPQDHSQGANQSGKGRSLSSQTLGEVESPLHRYLEKYQGMMTCWVPIRRSKAIISDWINWMKCCLAIECEIQAERKGKSKSAKNPKTIPKTIWKIKGWTSWLKPVPQVEVFVCIHHMDWTKSSCKEFWQLESKVQSQDWPGIWKSIWINLARCLIVSLGPSALSPSFLLASLLSIPRIRSLACVGVGSSLGAWLHHTHLGHSSAQQSVGELPPVRKGRRVEDDHSESACKYNVYLYLT